MRSVSSIPRFAALVLLGLVFALALARSPSVAGLSALRPSASPALPPPGAPHSAQEAVSSDPATGGLACIQNALGGIRAFANVSSLRILAKTKPNSTSRAANTREIGVVFPDRYKRRDAGIGRHEGLTLITGFNGNVLLSYPRPPDEAANAMMMLARREFVWQVLRRLPRQLPGVRMSQRTARDTEPERLAIDAHGFGGLTTLLADPRTCIPIAVEYVIGSEAHRVDLSEFRRFGGILFPTVLRTWKNGQLYTDEYVSEVQVNTPIEDAFFRQ